MTLREAGVQDKVPRPDDLASEVLRFAFQRLSGIQLLVLRKPRNTSRDDGPEVLQGLNIINTILGALQGLNNYQYYFGGYLAIIMPLYSHGKVVPIPAFSCFAFKNSLL